MSVQQYFNEVEAVCQVLSEYVTRASDYYLPGEDQADGQPVEEEFTAIWQAVELLSRAYSVLLPMVQAELAKGALVLPDPQPKAKPTLYGPGGEAL